MSPVFFLSSSPLAVQLPVLSFGGCSACSGRSTRHSHGRAAARVDRPNALSCLCIFVSTDCESLSHFILLSSTAEWRGRNEKEYFFGEEMSFSVDRNADVVSVLKKKVMVYVRGLAEQDAAGEDVSIVG